MLCTDLLDGTVQYSWLYCSSVKSMLHSLFLPSLIPFFLPTSFLDSLLPSSFTSYYLPTPLPPSSHPPLSYHYSHLSSPQATKLLKKSVKTNPSHAASWVALARIHQRTGQVLHFTVMLCLYVHAFIHGHVYVRVKIRLYIYKRASPSFWGRLVASVFEYDTCSALILLSLRKNSS